MNCISRERESKGVRLSEITMSFISYLSLQRNSNFLASSLFYTPRIRVKVLLIGRRSVNGRLIRCIFVTDPILSGRNVNGLLDEI